MLLKVILPGSASTAPADGRTISPDGRAPPRSQSSTSLIWQTKAKSFTASNLMVLVEAGQRGVAAGDEEQRVAVGRCARDVFARDQSAGAGARLHDEAAVDRGADAIADQAAKRVGLPTVQRGQDDADRTGRQVGGLRAHDCRRHRNESGGNAESKNVPAAVTCALARCDVMVVLPSACFLHACPTSCERCPGAAAPIRSDRRQNSHSITARFPAWQSASSAPTIAAASYVRTSLRRARVDRLHGRIDDAEA